MYLTVLGQDSFKVDGYGALATATIGNGVVSATVAEVLQIMWTSLLTYINTHVHGDATGAVFSAPIPTWNSNAASDKLTFPSN